MTNSPHYWKKAKLYLSKKDKVMKYLIKKYDDTTLSTRKDVFYSLCKSIIGQQISVAAANSVFSKFNIACKKKITPRNVKKLGILKLKKCGLSKQKAIGIKELSIRFLNKSFDKGTCTTHYIMDTPCFFDKVNHCINRRNFKWVSTDK